MSQQNVQQKDKLSHPSMIRANELNIVMQVAKARERFRWEATYTGLLAIGTGVRWASTLRFPSPMLLPISAMFFLSAWEWDTGYGGKLMRVNAEAFKILQTEYYQWFKKV